MNVAWVVLHCNRRIGARERRQLIPHVRFQVPFLGPESQLKSGFACAGLLCSSLVATALSLVLIATAPEKFVIPECTDTLEAHGGFRAVFWDAPKDLRNAVEDIVALLEY